MAMSNLAAAIALHDITSADKRACVAAIGSGVRNLSHATAVYLTVTHGTYTTDALTAWLRTVDPQCSGKAAGNRVCMQRHPDRYGVQPRDRYVGDIVAAGRSGRASAMSAASDADIAAWLDDASGADAVNK